MTETSQQPGRKRSALYVLAAKILITAVLLSVCLLNADVRMSIESLFSKIPYYNFLVAAALFLFAIAVNTLKWKLLLPQYRFSQMFRLNLIGRYYSLLLPGQLFGDVAKGVILGRLDRDYEKVAASIVMDKLTGLAGMLLVALLGLLSADRIVSVNTTTAVVAAIAVCLLLIFALRLNPDSGLVAKMESATRGKAVFAVLAKLFSAWHSYSGRKLILLACILLGVFYQLIGVLIIMLFAGSLDIVLPFVDWCWIVGILGIALFIPLTIGGIGIREGTLIGVLGCLGIAVEQALALSFADFGLYIVFALVGGVLHLKSFNNAEGGGR
ncbi:MAG TPA: hypothetical protein DET40_01195 [Lentisphaeria bacterium]|nr:MAG: hypothetical protein A2X45_12685 [Lentisphaerae bacterium GWF2_50_93]HCE42147.1 hypothetical protein [Lentisphaeria bacterium]